MCSFIFTNRAIEKVNDINHYTQMRGPDHTEITSLDGYHIIHNLLSITGEFTPQPFMDDNIVCFYNGQIYNYQDFGITCRSDGEILIPLYQEHGIDFIKKLDGEFALVIIDFNKQLLIVSTDTFATKPMWIAIEDSDIGIASYASALYQLGFREPGLCPENTTTVYRLNDFRIVENIAITQFNLDQKKHQYDDWLAAFSESIRKRTQHTNDNIFIGISSGYDSGAIAAELNHQQVNYKAYSIPATENTDILAARELLIENFQTLSLDRYAYQRAKAVMWQRCEDFTIGDYHFKEDKGAVGVSVICQAAKADHRKIHLSGQGADEILSDYGRYGEKIYSHSTLGGAFPEDLTSVFPWRNFFSGTQRQYLSKEEYVGGAYGLETRYPFLDLTLVQEFLWLSATLKNKYYKAPLQVYLERSGFPFEANEKIGFQANKNLIGKKKNRIRAFLKVMLSKS